MILSCIKPCKNSVNITLIYKLSRTVFLNAFNFAETIFVKFILQKNHCHLWFKKRDISILYFFLPSTLSIQFSVQRTGLFEKTNISHRKLVIQIALSLFFIMIKKHLFKIMYGLKIYSQFFSAKTNIYDHMFTFFSVYITK